MRLIGMLDSPYVRRVAISMKLMRIAFAHEPLSVFRDYDAFAAVNPIVKAPTLVTEGGLVLMDSSLILEHLERVAPIERWLMPTGLADHAHAQRIVGLALVACEKSVQIVYETTLRPSEKQHRPWIERVSGQAAAAYRAIEAEIANAPVWLGADRLLQPAITTAVAWRFTQSVLPELIPTGAHPALAALSARCETLPEFMSTPME